jgi:hypothetical protein
LFEKLEKISIHNGQESLQLARRFGVRANLRTERGKRATQQAEDNKRHKGKNFYFRLIDLDFYRVTPLLNTLFSLGTFNYHNEL